MAHSSRLYSLAHVAIGIISSAMFAIAGSAARALDAFVGLALAMVSPSPVLALAGATTTVRVLGLHETRSFADRLMARSDTSAPGWRSLA